MKPMKIVFGIDDHLVDVIKKELESYKVPHAVNAIGIDNERYEIVLYISTYREVCACLGMLLYYNVLRNE